MCVFHIEEKKYRNNQQNYITHSTPALIECVHYIKEKKKRDFQIDFVYELSQRIYYNTNHYNIYDTTLAHIHIYYTKKRNQLETF